MRKYRAFFDWLREALLSPGVGGVLARGASAASAIRASGMAVAFAVQILLARLLGAEEYGVYAYALSWLTLLGMASATGFDNASLRFIPEYRGRQRRDLLLGYVKQGRRTATYGSACLALGGVLVVFVLRHQIGSSKATTFLLAFAALPLLAHLQLGSAILRGFKRIPAAQVPVELLRPTVVAVLAVAAVLLLGPSPDAPTAMGATFGANLVALAAVMWLLRKSLGRRVQEEDNGDRAREWRRVAFLLMGFTGSKLVLSQTDILVIGTLLDSTQAGIYAASSRLSGLVAFGLISVSTVTAPMISELFATNRRRELQRLLRLAAWVVFMMTVPAAAALALLGRQALSLFGAEFEAAYVPLLVLLAGQLFNALAGPVGYLMSLTGHEKQAIKILGSVAAANVGISCLLVPAFGITGAAVATLVATLLWNSLMLAFIIKKLKLNPTVTPFRRIHEQAT